MYAIKVIWNDGTEEYLKEPSGEPVRYSSLTKAKKQVEFMNIGMEGDCQSINVVKYQIKKEENNA